MITIPIPTARMPSTLTERIIRIRLAAWKAPSRNMNPGRKIAAARNSVAARRKTITSWVRWLRSLVNAELVERRWRILSGAATGWSKVSHTGLLVRAMRPMVKPPRRKLVFDRVSKS